MPTEEAVRYLDQPIISIVLSTPSNTTRFRNVCKHFRTHWIGLDLPFEERVEKPIVFVGQLVQYTEMQLLQQKNLGRVCLRSLNDFLVKKELALGMKLEGWTPPKPEESSTKSELQTLLENLSFDERQLLACANHLGIDPRRISKVEVETDGGGHFTGLKVVISIYTGRGVNQWVKDSLPKERPAWFDEYLEMKAKGHR